MIEIRVAKMTMRELSEQECFIVNVVMREITFKFKIIYAPTLYANYKYNRHRKSLILLQNSHHSHFYVGSRCI